jgi:hypothetical protein
MGIGHDALSVAAEHRCRIRDLPRIPADDDQRSSFRPSLAGNLQTDARAAANYDQLLTLEQHFGPLDVKQQRTVDAVGFIRSMRCLARVVN